MLAPPHTHTHTYSCTKHSHTYTHIPKQQYSWNFLFYFKFLYLFLANCYWFHVTELTKKKKKPSFLLGTLLSIFFFIFECLKEPHFVILFLFLDFYSVTGYKYCPFVGQKAKKKKKPKSLLMIRLQQQFQLVFVVVGCY